jgi:hypothetical protein
MTARLEEMAAQVRETVAHVEETALHREGLAGDLEEDFPPRGTAARPVMKPFGQAPFTTRLNISSTGTARPGKRGVVQVCPRP